MDLRHKFSFLMTPENIQKKIQSFAHSEFNTNNFTNLDNALEYFQNALEYETHSSLKDNSKIITEVIT